jgi:microcystin-dependent protein
MSTPFLGELKIVSFNFAPKGWAMCNGQLLPINQNQPLFALFGTMYGGDGRVNFALPNLQGRVPVGVGGGSFTVQGQAFGEVSHTLTPNELPTHVHTPLTQAKAATADQNLGGTTPGPTKTLAQGIVSVGSNTVPANIYGTGAPNITMSAAGITKTGGSQPHANQQPFLTLNICVALQGIFPSRN